jgi:hypothetical protein
MSDRIATIFPHSDHHQICGCQDFASAVDTGNNCFMPE